MQWIKRFGYYLVGLSLGTVAVLFFWKQKNVSFDYLPNARTLKNIRIKKRLYSEEAKKGMQTYQIDTAQISRILKTGDVIFSKSKPRQKPCREYWINATHIKKPIAIIVKNCDSTALIDKVILHKK